MFIIKKSILVEALNQITTLVSMKSMVQVSDYILFKLTKKYIEISSTNFEIFAKVIITEGFEIEKEREVLFPKALIKKIISILPNGNIVFKEDSKSERYIIQPEKKSSKNNFKINYTSLDFPEFPISDLKNVKKITIENNTLYELFKKTTDTIGDESFDLKYSGIHFFIEKDLIRAVSSDTSILSLIEKEQKSKILKTFILTGNNVKLLMKVLKTGEEKETDIYILDNIVLFNIENIQCVVDLIDGEMIKYELITSKIDKIFKEIKIEKEDFKRTMQVLSTVDNRDWNRNVYFNFDFKKSKILVNSITPSVAEANAEMKIEKTTHTKNFEAVLTFDYLMIMLENIDTDYVILKVKDGANPFLFTSDNKENQICILMPKRG